MKRVLIACALVGGLSIVLAARAREALTWPGSACQSYANSAASDNIFSRSMGNGLLHNNSSSAATVTCPVSHDGYASTGQPSGWQIDAQGTSGWDVTRCNLFAESFGTGYAFPSDKNKLTQASGYTKIRGAVSPPAFQAYPLAILCDIPAGNALIDYYTTID